MKEELARKMVSLVQFLHAFFPLFKTSPFMLVGISLLSIQNADVRQLVVRQTFILKSIVSIVGILARKLTKVISERTSLGLQ